MSEVPRNIEYSGICKSCSRSRRLLSSGLCDKCKIKEQLVVRGGNREVGGLSVMVDKKLRIEESTMGFFKVYHGSKEYSLKVNNQGQLILSAGGNQIVIKPYGGNCIRIEMEE